MEERAVFVRNAFMQDIKRWSQALGKQLSYLDEVAGQLITSRYINRKSLNRVQTLQIEIKTELAKYHKEQQAAGKPYRQTVERYRTFMKSFSELLREAKLVRSLVATKSAKFELVTHSTKSQVKYFEPKSPKKKYMQDTFNVKVNRQMTASKLEELNDGCAWSQKKKMDAQRNTIYNMVRTESAKRKVKQDRQYRDYEQAKASTVKMSRYRSEPIIIEPTESYYGLKSQMNSLKSLLMELHRELDFHRHPQLEGQVHQLKIRYNKMKMNIEDIKQENNFLLENISYLNRQLKKQRKRFKETSKESRLLRNISPGKY